VHGREVVAEQEPALGSAAIQGTAEALCPPVLGRFGRGAGRRAPRGAASPHPRGAGIFKGNALTLAGVSPPSPVPPARAEAGVGRRGDPPGCLRLENQSNPTRRWVHQRSFIVAVNLRSSQKPLFSLYVE